MWSTYGLNSVSHFIIHLVYILFWRVIWIRIGWLLVASRDYSQLHMVQIWKYYRDYLQGPGVSEVGRLWYSIHSALRSIRPISSLAEQELQHRGSVYDNGAIQHFFTWSTTIIRSIPQWCYEINGIYGTALWCMYVYCYTSLWTQELG